MYAAHERAEFQRKPMKCLQCGRKPIAEILYGMPTMDADLEQKIKEGLIAIGGCCITADDPAWECAQCGLQVYRSKKNSS